MSTDEDTRAAYAVLRDLVEDLLDALPADAAPGAVRHMEAWLASHCCRCGARFDAIPGGDPPVCEECRRAGG